MKLRDSGMPEEAYWESLLDVPLILASLGIDGTVNDIAELGCGYGTFTIPIARAIRGKIYALDIDPEMVARTEARAKLADLKNVVCIRRDVSEEGFGLLAGSMDAILLFNILHCEEPQALLRMAADAVIAGGRVLVIHWRVDLPTPRGPSLNIRPPPEQIIHWATATGQLALASGPIDLRPWHYGLQFRH